MGIGYPSISAAVVRECNDNIVVTLIGSTRFAEFVSDDPAVRQKLLDAASKAVAAVEDRDKAIRQELESSEAFANFQDHLVTLSDAESKLAGLQRQASEATNASLAASTLDEATPLQQRAAAFTLEAKQLEEWLTAFKARVDRQRESLRSSLRRMLTAAHGAARNEALKAKEEAHIKIAKFIIGHAPELAAAQWGLGNTEQHLDRAKDADLDLAEFAANPPSKPLPANCVLWGREAAV